MAECGNGSEATGLPGAQQPCYDDVIQRKIRPIFENYINPNNVLTIFWKYDQNVLVKRDIELVQAMTLNIGITAGAGKLLELLCKYENWVPCLIQVLKDEEVNQTNVARMILYAMEMIKSDKSVDINLKVLTEKDILIEGLRTELEESKRKLEHEIDEHARKEKEMLEQKVLAEKMMLQQKIQAEKDKQDQELIIQKLKAELKETNRKLEQEKDRHATKEKEMLQQKVLLEKSKQDQDLLIQKLKTELEEMLEQEAQAEKNAQDLNKLVQELETDLETLVHELLRNTTNIFTSKPIMVRCAECGQYRTMRKLIERGVDINMLDSDGKTALMFAAGDRDLDCLNWLLQHGADIDITDKAGCTALSYAAANGRYGCVQALLEAGKNKHVNKSNIHGHTPLMLAAGSSGDNVECLQELLNVGADINSKDDLGYSVLAHAGLGGNIKCVHALLQAGNFNHINLSDDLGRTPLMLIAGFKGDNVLCLQKLLEADSDINMKDYEGNTALAHAALGGNLNCVQTLIKAGSYKHVNISNMLGKTPLMLAARSKGDNILCLQILLESGAHADVRDWYGWTALMHAAAVDNIRCKQVLCDASTFNNTTDSSTIHLEHW